MRPSDAKLAAALHEAGLKDLAALAEKGYYNEFFGELETPQLTLMQDLVAAGTKAALDIRQRVMNGDFDSGDDESDEWAASEAGQRAMSEFSGRK